MFLIGLRCHPTHTYTHIHTHVHTQTYTHQSSQSLLAYEISSILVQEDNLTKTKSLHCPKKKYDIKTANMAEQNNKCNARDQVSDLC